MAYTLPSSSCRLWSCLQEELAGRTHRYWQLVKFCSEWMFPCHQIHQCLGHEHQHACHSGQGFHLSYIINYSPNLNNEQSLDLLWAFLFFFFLSFLGGLCWSSVTLESVLLSLSEEESWSSTKFQISYSVKVWWIGYILAIFFLFKFNWSSATCDSDSLSLSNDSADVVRRLSDSGTESAAEPWVDGSSVGDVREEVLCGSLAAFTKFLWDVSRSVPMMSSFNFWAGQMVRVGQLEAILGCCNEKLIIYNSSAVI